MRRNARFRSADPEPYGDAVREPGGEGFERHLPTADELEAARIRLAPQGFRPQGPSDGVRSATGSAPNSEVSRAGTGSGNPGSRASHQSAGGRSRSRHSYRAAGHI